MTKKDKNEILIVFLYFLSFLIFDLVIVIWEFDGNVQEIVGGNCDVFTLLASFADAGVYHFIFITIIAVCVKISKKIDIEYKNIIRYFPLCTFILALPMSVPTAIIIRMYIYLVNMF